MKLEEEKGRAWKRWGDHTKVPNRLLITKELEYAIFQKHPLLQDSFLSVCGYYL